MLYPYHHFPNILGEERHNILDSQLNLTEIQTLHLSPLSGRCDTSEKPYELRDWTKRGNSQTLWGEQGNLTVNGKHFPTAFNWVSNMILVWIYCFLLFSKSCCPKCMLKESSCLFTLLVLQKMEDAREGQIQSIIYTDNNHSLSRKKRDQKEQIEKPHLSTCFFFLRSSTSFHQRHQQCSLMFIHGKKY